ncbi:MAG: hypothetical protein P1U89_00235 [Verrucomicrobiales bacterium]|nr:hypothetical protein [Verrucomicrobiales bacterium]
MKVNCPTCLESTEFSAELANSVQRCPTCNNDIRIPEKKTPKPVEPKIEVKTPEPKPEPRRERYADRVEKESKPGFSFRIFASVLFLLLFLLASILYAAVSTVFYFRLAVPDVLLENKDLFYGTLGIEHAEQFTPQLYGLSLAKSLGPAFLTFLAMIAILQRKRILAIIWLTLLVLVGFVYGTPLVAILCLILVCVPGRSDVWDRN